MKRKVILGVLLSAWMAGSASAQVSWDETLERARGQEVYFNAWGGSEAINDYILWAADEVRQRYGIRLEHVKADAGDVVSRVLAEKAAGRTNNGTVDLVWINGENFAAMKEQGLLREPWTQQLPNYRYVDEENKPTVLMDFSTPVDHMEAPWGMAQLVFMYDSRRVSQPPRSMTEMLAFAQSNPGRVTYPAPPSFFGTTFLKQALYELTPDPSVLARSTDGVDVATVTQPLWDFLDDLHAVAWQNGRTFPGDAPEMKQLLNDGAVLISLSFNPNDAANAIALGELPPTVRTYVHDGGTIGNTHFVAIPFNARAPEAAMVVADFLMSPEAQARKADPAIWGDPTVLSLERMTMQQQRWFADIDLGPATLTSEELAAVLPEPHASWVSFLEQEWQNRYAR